MHLCTAHWTEQHGSVTITTESSSDRHRTEQPHSEQLYGHCGNSSVLAVRYGLCNNSRAYINTHTFFHSTVSAVSFCLLQRHGQLFKRAKYRKSVWKPVQCILHHFYLDYWEDSEGYEAYLKKASGEQAEQSYEQLAATEKKNKKKSNQSVDEHHNADGSKRIMLIGCNVITVDDKKYARSNCFKIK